MSNSNESIDYNKIIKSTFVWTQAGGRSLLYAFGHSSFFAKACESGRLRSLNKAEYDFAQILCKNLISPTSCRGKLFELSKLLHSLMEGSTIDIAKLDSCVSNIVNGKVYDSTSICQNIDIANLTDEEWESLKSNEDNRREQIRIEAEKEAKTAIALAEIDAIVRKRNELIELQAILDEKIKLAIENLNSI